MRPRTLRARLVAGMLVLLALACAGVGAATSIMLERFMVDRIDQQLSAIGGRFAASLEHRDEYGDDGDTRGQSPGTLGVRLVNGGVTDAAVVSPAVPDPVLSAADRSALAALPADGRPRTLRLSSLHHYRVTAVGGDDGDVLITGLPLEGIESTVHRLQFAEVAVFAAVMLVTGVAAALWVRLSLRPLQRVAATAREVARLPLADGDVALPGRVPDEDPRTEIGQVGEAFNRMLGHVGDALARRHASEQRMRTFAADASHELRTPLATVRAHVQLARREAGDAASRSPHTRAPAMSPGPSPAASPAGPAASMESAGAVPESVRHALERIDAESARMGKLVDDLLLLTRLDAGRPLARDEVDLTRVAIDATGDARVSAPDHRWRLELPEEPVTMTGDADRLYQVVANLLGNASAHTPPGTTVTVGVAVPGPGTAELTVADDGPGIPGEIQDEIFERFVRADKARSRASGGSGLGLAIVKAVAAAHGGTVGVESRPGRTVFRVVFPRT
ncbi:sensor histidine kinase [Microbispora sp. ATCC PTA-5024]|uniref:sensor histidine kinase n=1 Tax=Microbispora sp. ATCC PTA-5024 TaxID=316330 RepID=UPI0003DB6B67|nr:HAMP domain-containing sensor histidine kinase [Microbispora sp. ATCC PTA-5024]ETK32600.1 histidine kinase [Microbispora sp. ATCC PTA-5024]